MTAPVVVVGIGADGWAGLGEAARSAIAAAPTVIGSRRQLDLLPELDGERLPWPSPIDPLVEEIAVGGHPGACVLASGDPMLHGIGATLARRLRAGGMVVHPHPSAFALACARLGWPAAEVELVSAVGRPPEVVARSLQPGRRLVVYVSGPGGAAGVARVAADRGFGAARMVVMAQLGGAGEQLVETTPDAWGTADADPLHLVALDCEGVCEAPLLPRTPGLPDDVYDGDGQLTKRPIRAITLAALGPRPRALLWDVGAGSGTIAIEWLRAEPTARAVAVEHRAERAATIAVNARRLGVPAVEVVRGRAPEALDGLDAPDAVFVGGGLTAAGLLEACWSALRPGGTLVANAVTLEGEQALHRARAAHGGDLLRVATSRPEPIGGFEGWRPQRPVVQWAARKVPS